MFKTIRQAICWHDDQLKHGDGKIWLECQTCGKTTTGWSVKKEVVTAVAVTGVVVGLATWLWRRK